LDIFSESLKTLVDVFKRSTMFLIEIIIQKFDDIRDDIMGMIAISLKTHIIL